MAVCAVAAFAAAFFAAGAGNSTTTPTKATHPRAVSFTDPAASAVAVGVVGRPTELKLPVRRHIRHHATPLAATVTPAAVATPTQSQPVVATTAPPPVTHSSGKKNSSGSGHGVTTIP